MPRNSAGTYSLPESAFVPNTVISSASINSDLGDLGNAITDSLSRTGLGGMTSALGLSLSGFFYTSDPDTGLSRTAANTQSLSVGGVDYVFSPTGLILPAGATVTNSDGSPIGMVPFAIYMWMFAGAPAGTVLLYGQPCTTAFPILRANFISNGSPYGNNGTDPLFPDLRCVIPAGRGDMGGSNRGILAGSTVTGALLGAESVTLNATQMPAHTHGGTTGAGGVDHTHLGVSPPSTSGQFSGLISPNNGWSGAPSNSTATGGASAFSHTHPFTTDSAGGGLSHANVQPTIILNFITRAV